MHSPNPAARIGVHQRHDGSAKTTAGEPGGYRPLIDGDVDQQVDLGERHLVVVPQAGVALLEQPAQLRSVRAPSAIQGRHRLAHPVVLGDDMTDPAVEKFGYAGRSGSAGRPVTGRDGRLIPKASRPSSSWLRRWA